MSCFQFPLFLDKARLFIFAFFISFMGCCFWAPGTVCAHTVSDPDCPEDASSENPNSFGGVLYQAHSENIKARIAATQRVFRDMKYKDKAGCILQIMTYFESIQSILAGIVSVVAVIILGVINAILGKICEFIVTGINNLLSMICLPVPNLGLSLSLPSLQRETCDGMSLGNFMSVSGGYSGYGGAFPGSLNPMMLMEPRKARRTTVPVF